MSALDLKLKRFGSLVPVERFGSKWLCLCDCGKSTLVLTGSLTTGRTKSCGCGHKKADDLSGMIFSRLTVIDRNLDCNKKGILWNCLCKCGVKLIVSSGRLKSGNTKSCGCLRKENTHNMFKKHDLKGTPEYCSWQLAKDRCYNKNNKTFSYYGGKGITVCAEWIDNPIQFVEDMGLKPEESYTLDRIDSSKGYSKENCRWASKTTQSRNRSDSVLITFNGVTKQLFDWCDELGVKYSTAQSRYYENKPIEHILNIKQEKKYVVDPLS